MRVLAMMVCVAAILPGAPPISGSGKFRYQYDPTKLQLPSSVQLVHGHGLTRDKAGWIAYPDGNN